MSPRAPKRQKRGHVTANLGESQDAAAYHSEGSKEEDESEEEIRRPGRRLASKNGPTTPRKGRTVQLSHRKKGEDGLRQSALDFSKARTLPTKLQAESPSNTQGAKQSVAELEGDLIQDDDGDSLDEDLLRRNSRKVEGRPLQAANSASLDLQGFEVTQRNRHTLFKADSLSRTINGAPRAGPGNLSDSLPWAQQYAPRNLDELGVHKRKVADVRSWIDNVLNGYERKRLLIIRGPAGSGKTATVQALSSVLGFSILEWRNPLTNVSALGEYRSGTASFEDFLSRGQRYGALDLAEPLRSPANEKGDSTAPDNTSRRVILMEEDPQSYTHNTTALQNFRSSIQRYLHAEESLFNLSGPRAAASLRTRPPIVMIISESANASSGPFSDTVSAHRLLGPEILAHPRVTSIEFNPVAPTILTKALELVASRAQRDGAATVQLSPAVLHKLAESGDLRGAIGTLEFLSRRHDSSTPYHPSKTKTKGKGRGKASQSLTTSEFALLEALAPRSPMIDLFHAVGRVVYNKRQPSTTGSPTTNNPTLVPENDPDDLLSSTSHDLSTFIAALHENCILSCAGESFVDTFNSCSDALSLSDILSTDPASFRPISFASTPAADAASLRQSDLAAHVAVRGLQEGLPYPVQRKGYVDSRDAYKMFYPESVRVRGRAEEVKDGLRAWSGASAEREGKSIGLGRGGCGALEDALLTEVPFRAFIYKARDERREVERLAVIAGLSNSTWVEEKVADEKSGDSSAFEKWKKGGARKVESAGKADRDKSEGMQPFVHGVGEKWVLSDDDIMD